jgi:hypothetical protein
MRTTVGAPSIVGVLEAVVSFYAAVDVFFVVVILADIL